MNRDISYLLTISNGYETYKKRVITYPIATVCIHWKILIRHIQIFELTGIYNETMLTSRVCIAQIVVKVCNDK